MNKKNIIIILTTTILIIIAILAYTHQKSNTKYYLELIGSDVTLKKGEIYKEPGYKAYDSNGNILIDEVIIENNININEIGEYAITYRLKEKILYRKVNVINNSIINDNQNKINMQLIGDETIYIPKNELYQELGIIATNQEGIDISSQVTIHGEVNTKNPNTYTITYSIGNNYIERKVIIYELKYQYDKSCTREKCVISLTFNDYYYDKVVYPSNIISKDRFINYTVTENGTYKFTIYDKYGYTIIKEVNINEIIKLPPEPSYEEKPNEQPLIKPETSNKITNNLFVGDSRTVGMCKSYGLCGNSEYIAEISKNYAWFINTAVNEINQKILNQNYNIIILMGVNDASSSESTGKKSATKYYDTISSLATSTWKNQNIIFVSVNPVIDGYSYTYTTAVNAFNKEIKFKISSSGISNLNYCDTSSKLKITTNNAPDGLHYNKVTYQEIYNIIINECI